MPRFKNRYLLFELKWRDGRADDAATDTTLLSALRDSLQLTFGDAALGAALASLHGAAHLLLCRSSLVLTQGASSQ